MQQLYNIHTTNVVKCLHGQVQGLLHLGQGSVVECPGEETTSLFKQGYTVSDNGVTEKELNLGLRGKGCNAVETALLWELMSW